MNWDFIKHSLAFRREERRLLAQGYRIHETDWEINRGGRHNEIIVDARVSVCGKYVYTKLGKRTSAPNAERASVSAGPCR
jgi:hypothetical protein